MAIRVQEQDFDLSREVADLTARHHDIGAIVTFTGIVRDKDNIGLLALELEHYPGMTQAALGGIEAEARHRWPLSECLIIHRYGSLELGAQIMMVATASPHREAAFEAAEFIMDYLKSRAPFWKKERTKEGGHWVDARVADEDALRRW
jgi:molybdopterin synthase catalytic subunit